jgi:hypothetical protein
MNDQEINNLITTQILGWTHLEGNVYQNTEGAYVYAADYCNSVAHALDLAQANGIGLASVGTEWQATQVANSLMTSSDSVAAKAICLCLLAVKEIPVTQPEEIEEVEIVESIETPIEGSPL